MEIEYYNRHRDLFKWASYAIHVVGAVHFTAAVLYDYISKTYYLRGVEQSYFYRLRFITHWNLYLQWVYFISRTAIDIKGMFEENSSGKNYGIILDHIQISAALPFTLFVFMSYWLLVSIDPKFVHSDSGPRSTFMLNQMIHTNILPLQLLDFVTTKKIKTSPSICLIACSVIQLLFFACLVYFYNAKGNWSYPIIGILSGYKRLLFIIGSYTVNMAFCYFGDVINSMLWGKLSQECHAIGGMANC